MNNNIFIDLEESEALFKVYQDLFPSKKIPSSFEFNKSISIQENLDNLALYAVNPRYTIPVFYSYNQIFLELISRWILEPAKFENALHSTNKIQGSVILKALSRLIQISEESVSLIEFYVKSNELEGILLAFYRLLSLDTHRFKQFITPDVLYSILKIENDSGKDISKYLSIQILSKYLEVSEVSRRKMLSSHVGDDNELLGSYETDDEVSYKFLPVLEAKRLSNFTNLPARQTNITKSNKIIAVEPKDISTLVTSICGVLVPHFIHSENTLDSTCEDNFVPTDKSIYVLRKLAHNIQVNKPVMLYGMAGSGKTFLINQLAKYMKYDDSIVKIHLGEQTDSKLLLGTYSSGEKPGTFEWRSGVLTTAVKEGKWVLIEDIDKAPTEVLSVLLTLLEKRELSIPSRGEIVKAKNGFQLISTIRIANDTSKITIPDIIGLRMWELIHVQLPSDMDLKNILSTRFPLLDRLVIKFIQCFKEIIRIYSSSSFISLNKGSHPRVISFRDLIKFCSRCNRMLINLGIKSTDQLLESSIYDNIFAEAVDCFGSAITEYSALLPLISAIGEVLEIPSSRINLFLNKHIPSFYNDDEKLQIGRATLKKSLTDKALFSNKASANNTAFARTNHSLKLMEQVGVAIDMVEPVLLVGETGTGKTTVIQQIAKMMNKKLTVINVSQQTESGDLLGGYKPVNTKTVAVPIQEIFENLFMATFSKKKNEKFATILSKCFNKSQWRNVIKLWNEAIRMAKDILSKVENDSDEEGGPKKKRKLKSHEKSVLLDKWVEFENKVKDFEFQASSLENSFVFNFVEGSLVKAVRNGEWLLLDEINLASSDTLESIADLLSESLDQRSILLSERGDIDDIKAHPDFRIFGCMNPSTDVGKKDLPLSIRSRLTEIYVHSPDRDIQDLLSIIDKYIGRFAVGDEWVGNDIAELYLEAKKLSESNKIVDGANQKPHFSIRTLTRTLLYVCDIISVYGLRRSLFEGFCMSFLTLLDIKSENILKPLIEKYTIGRLKNIKSVMSQCPPLPSTDADKYVQFKHYWLKRGPGEIVPQPHYIITPFVEKNMLNLVRATAGSRFPVLVQGPTSAGKTSMINYLANITGHKFVRINNHEHTDLQEYLGTYVSDSTGKLVFKEGILVEALRKGHWIVLDELNLAPTDVLEALNRLLDDNRELFIPETQEVVHPHPDFMLFATQNPPGLYGGRKVLSRAFRNRFLELHFDDIPQDELEIILKERCQIAPSYGKKIVEVYKQLSIQRQSSRLFEQKNSFATLRDLFRWALREAVGYEELASNGYMLLAERVRKEDEKFLVKQTIEKVMKVKLDMDAYYEKLENKELLNIPSSIVWTKAMRRLAVLVMTSIKYKEPLLLVGETGCGKTTVCQVISKYLNKKLISVNAHQNTETGDILGAQRPVRNRFETRTKLVKELVDLFEKLNITIPLKEIKLEEMVKKYNEISKENIDPDTISSIEEGKRNCTILFEWNDGPLTHAMKDGQIFLLDEISLADDSVLERLNSVLEPERSLLLAEKGTDDAFVQAADGFEFLATMNPGGDYGKKELSPALRNRFTEIWAPSMEDFNDVRQIVSSKIDERAQNLVSALVDFSEWFGKKFGGGSANSGVISLRDILAWVEFINSCISKVAPAEAFLHGAALVFIDALGTNNTAYLAEDETRLNQEKYECVEKLSDLTGSDLFSIYSGSNQVLLEEQNLVAGSFSIPRVDVSNSKDQFNLHAPTTAANAMRVIRAMQVHKPILLEGSPGVGKTSLVSAISNSTGNPLVRINLSEQTDLVDLFGSDAPAEGGNTGEFVWRDAPFLRAMQKGEWVLLDEMNLASQSVLEGLNACLDHRGEAYIPELDKSFACHPDFKVFAAQNPQYQGGGRKGLPKSFVNRFTVVYVDVLKSEDLNLISQHIFPNIESSICEKMIEYMSKLEEEVVIKKSWGTSGGPWEFNLRDTLRWLSLFNSINLTEDINPFDFFNMIIRQRFRTDVDRAKALELFELVFGHFEFRDNFYHLADDYLQVGGAVIKRKDIIQYANSSNPIPLQSNFPVLESAIRCVNLNLPLILVGPTNSGKTDLVRFLAHVVGAKVDEFAMNSEVDSMDILGGYEQVDLTRSIVALKSEVKEIITELVTINLSTLETEPIILLQSLKLIKYIESNEITTGNYNDFNEFFNAYISFYSNPRLDSLSKESRILAERIEKEKSVRFEWFDGLLVKAVEKGNWLVLDNANLCSPSVLDRLNSLLETNGSLIINECSSADGQPRTLKPHPNFRLFLTVDPKYGELSRAMRNRGVEVYMDPLPSRATKLDAEQLGFCNSNDDKEKDNLVNRMETLKVDERNSSKPVLSFIPANSSGLRPFSLVNDFFVKSEAISERVNAIMSVIPFLEIESFKLFAKTVASTHEFSLEFKNFIHEFTLSLKFLVDNNVVGKMFNTYTEAHERASITLNCNVNFSKNQFIHPLVNNYILATISRSSPHVDSAEPTLLIEVASKLFEASSLIQSLEERATSGKIADLSYIEKSAAFELGRNIKKPPRLKIYNFVKNVSEYINKTFGSSFSDVAFKSETVYTALFELQIIWRSLFDVSAEQNEAKLRIFQNLVRKWTEKYENDEFICCFLDDLLKAVDLFGSDLELKTGFSMSKIWEFFRQEYPSSEMAWSNAKFVIDIAADFDEVAAKQFNDTTELVNTLRAIIIDLYEDVLSNRISDEDFNSFSEKLQDGISKLRVTSDAFINKRQNDFKHEFTLLSNFLETSPESSSKASEILSLSGFSQKSTINLSKITKGPNFNPYPSIFDSLFNENRKDDSYVDGIFTNELLMSTLLKSVNFDNRPGKYLKQNVDDMNMLSRKIIENSTSLLADQREYFVSLLFSWFTLLIDAHKQSLSDEAREEIKKLLNNHEIGEVKFTKIIELLKQSNDGPFVSIFEDYMVPSLYVASASDNLKALGKAWVLFSCGAIQLYVPSSAYDPAIEEHVVYKNFEYQQEICRNLAKSWSFVRDVFSGEELHLEKLLPKVDDSEIPKKPRVFRKDVAIDDIFEEWKALMESTVDIEPVKKLLQSAEELSKDLSKFIEIFQNNTSQFLARLSLNYLIYSDLNDILRGYIFGLKLGFGLLSLANRNTNAIYSLKKGFLADVISITNEDDVKIIFENSKVLAKNAGVDSFAPEYIMLFFIQVAFAHKQLKEDPTLNGVLENSLQALYYRWTLRRMKQEEETAQQGSLYKYTDPDADIEGDFRSLFPDYEDVIEVDTDSKKKNDSFENIYSKLGKLYVNQFYSNNSIDLQTLMEDGSHLVNVLLNFENDLTYGLNSSSLLATLVTSLSKSLDSVKEKDQEINFYRDYSTSEFKRAILSIDSVHLATVKLLAQWPEHATLQNIVRASEEFLLYPVNSPVSKLIQKVEQIYTYIAEWEKYASSQVTLKPVFDELTQLIVSWRKLELSTWKSLFKYEDSVMEDNIGKWWFYLFETIIIPCYNMEESDLNGVVKLLSALNLFMSQATYGEFIPRINLIKAFKNHVNIIAADSLVFNALANFIDFYEQFTSTIISNIENGKKKLEKDVSEVILLASWKDVNIDALKQSARRSHNNLYKIVRKYRALLATAVTPMIEQGISYEVPVNVHLRDISKANSLVNNASASGLLCKELSTWSERPARLQNISIIDKNMSVYVSRIANEELPSLEEFTQDVVLEMERLRKETPTVLNDKTKKLVATLKTQKRKLLSDTLREIRRLGLKIHHRQDIQSVQATVNLILGNSSTFEKGLLKGADAYYYRLLDLLPRLRASVSTVAEDVPQADAEKGLAAVENLVFSLITTRSPLSELSDSVEKINEIYRSFEKISTSVDDKDYLIKASVVDSVSLNLDMIKRAVYWLPKIADFSISAINAGTSFNVSSSSTVFYEIRNKAEEFAEKLKLLDIYSMNKVTITFIEEFSAFYNEILSKLSDWKNETKGNSFIADLVLKWVSETRYIPFIDSSTSLSQIKIVEDIEKAFRDLSNAILVSVQRVIECQTEQITEEDDNWLVLSQLRLFKYIKSSHHKRILEKMEFCLDVMKKVEYNAKTSELAAALTSFTLPLIYHYATLTTKIFEKTRDNYVTSSKSTFILSNTLYTLATKGFCSPDAPNEQKEDNNLHDGTGLGDGEGAENNSKDVEQDDDLTEDAQQPNEENKEKDENDDENDDAVDMEGDMAGNLEEASDQEKEDEDQEDGEEEELDEEVDDIDDLDPNAVDEKMWDEEAKEDNKEKDSDKVPENSTNDDNMEANEDENEGENNDKKDKQDDEQEGEQNEDNDENDDNENSDDEGKDVGEQEDEVKNDENEQLEEHVPETETLDLPDDMNLDGDEDKGDNEEEENEEEFDDKMDVDDKKDDKVEEDEGNEEQDDNAEDMEAEPADNEDENMEEDAEKEDEPDNGELGINEEEGMESEEEAVGNEEEDKKQEEGGNDEEEGQDKAEGVDGANDNNDNEDFDQDAAVQTESGEKGEGADNQVSEENDDIGATGGASMNDQQKETEDLTTQDDARDLAKESLKELGDSLKEFHRRHQEIKEAAQEEKEEKVDQSANERPDEFQHIEGENTDFDTQALGAADKEQVQSIDEDKAIDDDEPTKEKEKDVKEEAKQEDENDMDVDQNAEEVGENDAEMDEDPDFEGKAKGGFIGERIKSEEDNELIIKSEFDEEKFDGHFDDNIDDIDINVDFNEPPRSMDEARELWKSSELATQELASGLCEQLRLILEPTLATKLRGDYKTGKRLNMKRIIPYIASEFRKDKIWLRRTKPSKRQYQIMIAVDDSKSMSESKSTELAFHSIALVSKALTQLESGGLSIVRFGEDVKLVHPFDKPFNNQETGTKIFQWFDFQQTKTDIKLLCNKALKIFEDARSSSNTDLWQLQIIISDGVCEDHDTIQSMVRKAREEKIMLVFVVIDGINSNESIMDMSQVRYEQDPNTGAMNLKVDKYLDSFPFEFYVVVRNINELPEMLSLILRQYFSEVASI
ncbi:midasin [Hyphopichia burtonii NRRL Y-1933]|uniref:Midasin n=1 Tax=Hyphopichia burtonii NRRL Y-1933 TaxID=984485 RepID=A0A1E4RII6_9ASCO|nr:midasin [Hyphopichia burtonii NRRL Y-1933]ODV67088.1 midasin [Hyphopichia burtonii NRRL Y-1933]